MFPLVLAFVIWTLATGKLQSYLDLAWPKSKPIPNNFGVNPSGGWGNSIPNNFGVNPSGGWT